MRMINPNELGYLFFLFGRFIIGLNLFSSDLDGVYMEFRIRYISSGIKFTMDFIFVYLIEFREGLGPKRLNAILIRNHSNT